MNILLIKHFFVGFMVSEIPRVSIFGYCPYSVNFPYTTLFTFTQYLKCSHYFCYSSMFIMYNNMAL